ncbi:Cwf21 [Zea mays]|uniref:Cwf21 n=1 Tax=Zea mays TaxID=4577 RepID=K7V3A3_MAIZE|nr:Cwf21 [Zea mays]
MRKPNRDIIEHERKRQVELRLLVLREALEEQGYMEAEIEARVDEARKATEAETASAAVEVDEGRPPLQHKGFKDTRSHHAAEQKEQQLRTVRAAFGLDRENVHKRGGI